MEAHRLSHVCDIETAEPTHETQILEEEELAKLTDRFGHRARFFAYRVERRFALDPQWRDDLISAGYWGLLKALRNRRADAHDKELSAYVSRRVEGAVIDEARRILNRISSHVDGDPADLDSDESVRRLEHEWNSVPTLCNPEQAADRSGRWRKIDAAVEHLEENQQTILWAYLEGQSISEIALRYGQSIGRIQNQLTRIGRQIRARSPELRRLLRYEI